MFRLVCARSLFHLHIKTQILFSVFCSLLLYFILFWFCSVLIDLERSFQHASHCQCCMVWFCCRWFQIRTAARAVRCGSTITSTACLTRLWEQERRQRSSRSQTTFVDLTTLKNPTSSQYLSPLMVGLLLPSWKYGNIELSNTQHIGHFHLTAMCYSWLTNINTAVPYRSHNCMPADDCLLIVNWNVIHSYAVSRKAQCAMMHLF